MKITILTRLMAALALVTAAPLTAQAAFNQILYTANYTGTPVLGTDTLGGVTYATVGYGDLYNDGQPGMPYLPVDYLRFSVPYNATNFTVAATCPVMYKTTRNLSHLVYPSQPPRLMNDTTPVVITLPDSTAYSTGGSYPMQPAWVVDEGFLDGENHIVTVAVMPFVYKRTSTSDKLEQWKRVNVRLLYDLSDSLAMYPIVRNDSTMREDGYNLARSMVVNPGQVKTFAPVDISNDFDSLGINLYGTTGDGLNGGIFPGFDPPDPTPIDTTDLGSQEMHEASYHYTYLIVTTDEYVHSLRRLAALKRQKGYNVKIVTMDQVLSSPYCLDGDRIKQDDGTYLTTFTDNAGKLRQYLKHEYCSNSLEYLLIVGADAPYRKKYSTTIQDSVPTDLYFGDLNANWYIVDSVDRHSEISVGRILAKEDAQINNYTNKLFRYELNPGHGDYGYLQRIFYSEGIDFETDTDWSHVDESYSKIFPTKTRYLEIINGLFPSGTDIINEINATRYGYLSFMNHGGPSGILTYGHRNTHYHPKDTTETTPHYYLWAIDSIHYINYSIDTEDFHIGNGLNNLDNKWYPSICYSSACTVMPYDKVKGYTRVSTNFGESFTTGRDYGGPAFLGNTRQGYLYNISSRLEKSFAESIHNGYYKIGLAEAISKSIFTPKRSMYTNYIAMIHNLLGDPEFELWTGIPQQYSNISITRNDNSIRISGINSDSTIVAIYNNGGQLSQTTVHNSNITLNANPNSTIMLYKHNYIPYIAPLDLQNIELSNNQYLIASDVTAGKFVDPNRTIGEVVVKNGIEYEIEASGTVTLQDGFKVEKGATFAVYPSCF